MWEDSFNRLRRTGSLSLLERRSLGRLASDLVFNKYAAGAAAALGLAALCLTVDCSPRRSAGSQTPRQSYSRKYEPSNRASTPPTIPGIAECSLDNTAVHVDVFRSSRADQAYQRQVLEREYLTLEALAEDVGGRVLLQADYSLQLIVVPSGEATLIDEFGSHTLFPPRDVVQYEAAFFGEERKKPKQQPFDEAVWSRCRAQELAQRTQMTVFLALQDGTAKYDSSGTESFQPLKR